MNNIVLNKKSGQALLLTVLVLGGILLGATVIAGILIRNQIRQSVNIAQSNQAIYAADSGLEWELYRFYKDQGYPKPSITINGVDFETCSPVGAICSGSHPTGTIRSIGASGRSSRAFEAALE
ncbi:MAG: hypothetical protein HY456_02455 [Parcubacteria group bacterium]|nr:hypothetical protein [Parcubacteria group bacterium]